MSNKDVNVDAINEESKSLKIVREKLLALKKEGITEPATEQEKMKTDYESLLSSFVGKMGIIRQMNEDLSEAVERLKTENMKKPINSDWHTQGAPKILGIGYNGKKVTFEGNEAQIVFATIKDSVYPKEYLHFIRDMSLVYLVAEIEGFLQNLLEVTYIKKPEILNACQKRLTLSRSNEVWFPRISKK